MQTTNQEQLHLDRPHMLPSFVRPFLNILPLILLLWLTRYLFYSGFGLYGDDHAYIGRALSMSNNEFINFVFNPTPLIKYQGSGHPLHPLLISIGARIGWSFGQLQGLYWIGYIIGSINVGLFYLLISRIHSRSLAIISGIVYVLFAADTTQAYLTFALGLQPSITLILLAGHAYLSRKYGLSYILSTLSLLTYETAYAITFAYPLLLIERGKMRWRKVLGHIVITSSILLLVLGWRAIAGESRLQGLNLQDMVQIPLTHMLVGPIVNIGTFFYRPFQVIQSAKLNVVLISFLISLISFVLLYWLPVSTNSPSQTIPKKNTIMNLQGVSIPLRLQQLWQRIDYSVQGVIRIAAIGLIMLVLAYPFTFTVRAYAITGRDTRVHATAVIGAAIFIGSIIYLVLQLVKSSNRRLFLLAILSIWLGLLGGFGILVQDDYRLAWNYQQRFWSSADKYIGAMEEGSIIAVEPNGLIDTRHIDANTWNLPYVLNNIYVFPEEWETIPLAYRLLPNWRERAIVNPTVIRILDYKWEWVAVPWSKLTLVNTEDGRITSQEETVSLDGVSYPLSIIDPGTENSFEANFLHEYLIIK
jgi:hypothetical protein